jgi:hypothetical protein
MAFGYSVRFQLPCFDVNQQKTFRNKAKRQEFNTFNA